MAGRAVVAVAVVFVVFILSLADIARRCFLIHWGTTLQKVYIFHNSNPRKPYLVIIAVNERVPSNL